MPEDTKKNTQKSKNEPKEQRRRRGRQPPAPVEKKNEKEKESEPKVTVTEKPAYEPPPPEFYKNLKRETDEILKITEEANSKYKKKEIQSNWAKYEMPIESYDEIDEQENLGADYEALSQAPLSVGGHFQFKHEKSWDISTGPSPYDKYFDIDMDSLNTALSTIPFYKRNDIETSFFNENDIQTMNHRATKFKQKYYKDKKFTTPEMEAHDKILNSLKSNTDVKESFASDNNNDEIDNQFKDIEVDGKEKSKEIEFKDYSNVENLEKPKQIQFEDAIHSNEEHINDQVKEIVTDKTFINNDVTKADGDNLEISDNVIESQTIDLKSSDKDSDIKNKKAKDEVKLGDVNIKQEATVELKPLEKLEKHLNANNLQKEKPSTVAPKPQCEPAKNPIIESPEDLEKWLDDFLDS